MTVPNVETQPGGSSVFSKFETAFPSFVNKTEPYFAMLGKALRIRSARTQDIWTQFALGEGPSERMFAVLLGYAVVGLLLALYLNILTVGNAKSAGRAVRNAVRQQLLVLKVATFIFIELVTFPLACGVVLDLCTVWLFPEANLHSRAAFFFQAPLTAMFYHWVAGTLFM
jgi:E3 ubiquitin-protein ligase MARCH6